MNRLVKFFNRIHARLVLISVILAICFWMLEAFVEAYFFSSQYPDFIAQVFKPGMHEAWMRMIVAVMFVLFGIYAQRIIVALKKAEVVAKLTSKELSQIFETSADGMRVVDKEFNVLRANETFVKLSGLQRDEIVGRKCYEVFSGPICHTPKCPMERILAGEGRVEQDEIKILKSGKIVPCIVTATPFLDLEGRLIGIVEDFKDISERKRSEEELKQSHDRLRELALHIELAREEERTRIAREIHDELGQTLTVLKMDIHWLGRRFPGGQEEVKQKIGTMSDLVDRTVFWVQRTSSELRPGLLDNLGLSAAIEWQAGEFRNRMGIEFEVVFEPEEITLDRDKSTAVFRIFQETLTNIARHSGASAVMISLTKDENSATLVVNDNGVGITEEKISASKSLGLMGMRERVFSLGGELKISGRENQGTVVEISIPLMAGQG